MVDIFVIVTYVGLMTLSTILKHAVEDFWFMGDITYTVQKSEENQPISVNLAILVAEDGRFYQFCYLWVVLCKLSPSRSLEYCSQRLQSDGQSIAFTRCLVLGSCSSHFLSKSVNERPSERKTLFESLVHITLYLTRRQVRLSIFKRTSCPTTSSHCLKLFLII